MDLPKSEVIGLIFQLLPGFMAAWIFYGLTAHPQKSPFERTIQALIFTGFIQAIVIPTGAIMIWVGSFGVAIGTWNASVAFVWSTIVGIALGIVVSTCANTNCIHHWLNIKSDGKITRRTSYPSEWFSAMYRRTRYVTLHLNDGRRLFGWPEEWPDCPGVGHFALAQPEWILEDNSRIKMDCAELLLVQAAEVRMIEFEMKEISDAMIAGDAQIQEVIVANGKTDIEEPEEPGRQNGRGHKVLSQRTAAIEDRCRTSDQPPSLASAAAATTNGEVVEFLD